jgi:hypothetical protein
LVERSRAPDEPSPGTEFKDSSVRTPLSAALTSIEQAGRGVLAITDGTKDVRLSVERSALVLDAKGFTLDGKDSMATILRAVERTLFWEGAVVDVDTNTPQGSEKKKPDGLVSARVGGDAIGAFREITRAVIEREKLRRKVPSVTCVVEKNATLSDQGTGPDAKLAKILKDEKRPSVTLLDLATRAGVDELDAAVGLGDLVDRGQAKIVRRHDPNTAASSLTVALEVIDDGICPGLRHQRAAGLVKEPRAAARLWRTAGEARLAAGRHSEAIVCFSEAANVVEDDVSSREGLVKSLEGAGRSKEARHAAEELGRLYLEVGLCGRARNVLGRIPADGLTPPVEEMLVRALAGAGDVGKATERAEALAPKLARGDVKRIAERLIAAGAKGAARDRVLKLGGWDREQRQARAFAAAGILLALAGLCVFWEGLARKAYAQACTQAREKLATGGPDETLAATFDSVASRYVLTPSGSSAHATAQAVRDLAADDAFLEKKGNELVVHNWEDPEQVTQRLAAFEKQCRSPGLRLQAHSVVMAFQRKRQEISNHVAEVKNLATSGDGLNALDAARKLLTDWPGARSYLAGVQIPVRVETSPAGATVSWNDVRIGASPVEVPLPANGSECTLKVTGNDMKPYERHVAVKSDQRERELMGPVIRVTLEPDPNARRPGTTKRDPGRPHPTIKLTENETPLPPSREKPDNYTVVDTCAEVVQKSGLSSSPEVESSERFFDFLAKGVITERCKITVELVNEVDEEQRLVFRGVRVRVEDLLMGRRVSPRMVEVDNCERLVSRANGTFKVLTLSRTTNLSPDSFREKVRDAVRYQCTAVERAER